MTARLSLVELFFKKRESSFRDAFECQLTFFSYIIADYERSSFSIHQMKWDPNAKGDIQTVLPLSPTKTAAKRGRELPTAVIVAIAVGGALFLTVSLVNTHPYGHSLTNITQVFVSCVIIIYQRHQRRKVLSSPALDSKSSKSSLEGPISPESAFTFKSELDARETQQISPELSAAPFRGTTISVRAFHEPDEIHELPAREPVGSEVVGSPVEVMLQQTIDSILEQHYRERMQESQARVKAERKVTVAEARHSRTDSPVRAPAKTWIRYG